MERIFNITGSCDPVQHYMDLSDYKMSKTFVREFARELCNNWQA